MMRRQFRRSLSSPETIRAMSSSSLLSIQSNHEDYDGVRIMDVSSSQQQQPCEEEDEQAAEIARMRRYHYDYDVDVVQGAIDEGYDGVRIVDVSSSQQQQQCEEEEEHEAEHAVRRRYHDDVDVVVQGANAPNIIIEEEEEETKNDANDPILIDDDYGFFPVDMDDDDDHDNDDDNDGSNNMMGVPNQPSHDHNINTNHNTNTNTNTTRTKKQRRSSSLKKGSSYGDLEALIPLNFDRKEYNRILPIPTKLLSKAIPSSSSSSFTKSTHKRRSSAATQDNPKGGVFHHASSEPVFVRPVYLDENDDDDENEEEINLQQEQPVGDAEGTSTSSSSGRRIPKRTISFGTIQIREHNVTLGDNPSVTRGVPIALDWSSQDFEAMQVDQYEDDYRTPDQIRSKHELLLSPYQRQLLLHGTVGYTPRALATTHQHITKIRQQRLHTKRVATQYPWLHELEDWLESGTRKFKRIVSFSSFK